MDADDLAFAGAARQAELIAAGQVSAREAVQAALDRIARADGRLNAFRVVFAERALVEADQADARRAAGDRRPLLGVPVAVKDDTDVAGEISTRGTGVPREPAAEDAEVVRRLRAAGAVIVGKTNVPEMGLWPWTESATHGASRNPWSLEHTPGGSSGGSGAATAAGLCGLAQGTDGAGSIRIPAAFCGVFGIKPQRGRLPIAPSASGNLYGMAHVGLLSRRVADAALAMDALADGRPDGGFRAALAREHGPMRIAVSTRPPPGTIARLGREQRAAVDATADVLRDLGHDVVREEIDYRGTGGTQALARFLRGMHDEIAAVDAPDRLEPRTRGMARIGGRVSRRGLARILAAEAALTASVTAVLATAHAVLLPGPTGRPFRVGEYDGRGTARALNAAVRKVPYYAMFNVTGQPAVSVPAGFDGEGLPLAIQLAGRPSDEATLLALAAQLERARPWADRRPPV